MRAAGPEDFDFVGVVVCPEADVDADIVLRNVAAATDDFASLREVSGGDAEARADGETI